ncbi:MAG TPA: hypothetical protein VHV27_11335 [Phenylobacterium sp.]|nr:hypothetical protein [Phenylobacterium sp.]
MVAPIASDRPAQPLASGLGKGLELIWSDLDAATLQRAGGALSIGLGLCFERPQFGDARLQRFVTDVGHTALDGLVEPLQPRIGLGRLPAQLTHLSCTACGSLLPAVEEDAQDLLQPGGIKQSLLQVLRHQVVQPSHRDRAALAAGLPLPGGDRAGVVTIAPGLSGADGHGAAAVGAETDAGEQRWAAHHLRRRDFRIARFQVRLHGVKRRLIEQRRDRHGDHLVRRLERLGLAALVELVAADVGRPGQHPMHRAHAPASARAGVELALVEVLGDGLDAHTARDAVTLQRQPEGQPHRVGVQRVDLQLLLDLGAALLGVDHPIADRWERTVPEPLAGVLAHGSERVLGRLLGLVFVKERHDLPHHDMHRILAQLLGHRDQPHAVLGELADVELQLEMVAKEAAERVDDHHVEFGRLGRARLHHPLELRPAVVGGCGACLHIGLDQLIAARLAVGLALPALVGDRDVVLGLARGGDPQIEGGAKRKIGAHVDVSAF